MQSVSSLCADPALVGLHAWISIQHSLASGVDQLCLQGLHAEKVCVCVYVFIYTQMLHVWNIYLLVWNFWGKYR